MTTTNTDDATIDQPEVPAVGDAETAEPAEVQHTDDTTEDAEEERRPRNREAAKYRVKLRETEAERDAANASLEAARRQLIELHATRAQVRPAALWASGATLDNLLDDDGQVDATKVQEACARAITELGLNRPGRPDPSVGKGANQPDTSFASAFRPR